MNYVTYLRVSTKRQGESGLGLEAQRTAVTRFTQDGSVWAELVEVESGKKAARPKLREALDLCRRTGATLVVAKLDRLARNVLFTATLMDAKVDFICCDMPAATRLTIHLMAAIAEDEARRISARTKAALCELKGRGVKLGSAREGHWEGREHLRGWGAIPMPQQHEIKRERIRKAYSESLSVMLALHERGVTFHGIAKTLNAQGIRTPQGKDFHRGTVRGALLRWESVQLST